MYWGEVLPLPENLLSWWWSGYGVYRIYGINGNNYLECEINKGKIIIYYPKKFNDNSKHISVIGELNYENYFLNEYDLIYNDSSSKSKIMHNIKEISIII